jgi:uncharacterized protein YndB with AHSA1/START domain
MPSGPSTRTTQLVRAPRERVYRAFVNQGDLLRWLPPSEMTGTFHAFDARPSGGHRMSLVYPPTERTFRGKASEREDLVDVRFVELAPPRRIVEAVTFITTDPAFAGEMTMTATLDDVAGGTQVTLDFENLPPGLRPEDNEAGSRLSLEQLARSLE